MSSSLQTGIFFHPNGCGTADGGIVTLSKPGSLDLSTWAAHEPVTLGGPAGGLQVQGMPEGVSITIHKSGEDGKLEDSHVLAVKDHDGCFDIAGLSDTIWWSFSDTPKPRSYPPSLPKREPIVSEIVADARDLVITSSELDARQDNTYTPPDDCYLDAQTCQSLADSGSLKAICVNCVSGYGDGFKASAEVDCHNSGTPCPITFTNTVTVTQGISADISFGASIGNTESTGSVSGTFSFGYSFSISTSHATAVGLSIPVDQSGYVDFAPQAALGTVVTTSSSGNVCDAAGLNKICGAKPGKIITSDKDENGKYSVHIT
ncbi:hypothetical protein CC79DRAFT_1372612 [Sarocladium strictum]